MTNEEAMAYFIDSNEQILSAAKDENIYNYETQQIEYVFMRKDFEAKELAIKAIEQTMWIPVSEELPPIAQRVLVSATNGEVFIARYHSFDKWTFEPTGISYAYNKDSIIAWMLLPQPYKAESEDKE